MNTRSFGLAATLAALVVLAAGASSAAGFVWSPVGPVAGSSGRTPILMTLDKGGAAAFYASGPMALFPGTPQVPVSTMSRSAGSGLFTGLLPLGALGEPLATSPAGTTIAIAGPHAPTDYFGGTGGPPVPLSVAIGPAGSPGQPISTANTKASVALAAAVNDRGDAAVLFARCRSAACSSASVWAIFRRRGRPFSGPVLLAAKTRTVDAPWIFRGAVAVNQTGDALLAWEQTERGTRERTVVARVQRSDGSLTRTRTITTTFLAPTIAVTLGGSRKGVVAVFSQAAGIDGAGPAQVTSALVSPAGNVSGRRVLDDFSPSSDAVQGVTGPRLRAVLGPDGVTTLVWTANATTSLVRSVRIPGSAAPATLSPEGVTSELAGLAVDPAGNAAIVWNSGDVRPSASSASGISVAVRDGAAAAFGPPELVLASSGDRRCSTAAVAIDGPHILLAACAEGPPALPGSTIQIAERTR